MGEVVRAGLIGLLFGLPGCFFFFDLIGPPSAVDTGADTGKTGLPPDTAPPPDRCYQQEAVDLGLLDFVATNANIDPDTLASSPVAPPPSQPPPGALRDEPYYGAVEPGTTPWWQGWTFIDPAIDGGLPGPPLHPLEDDVVSGALAPATTHRCVSRGLTDLGFVDVFGVTFPACAIPERVTVDLTLTPDHVYVLSGDVRFGDGDRSLGTNPEPRRVTLTVQAGTQVFAVAGTPSGLVITRGAEARVRGTAARPVVFSALEVDEQDGIVGDPGDLTGRGQWLGVVLSGRGLVNQADPLGETLVEAGRPSQRRTGGLEDADRSGDLDYVVIAEAGIPNWRSGLRLEAAGRGTTLDHVQIIGSEEHCIDAFGGAAFVRHLVCSGAERDAFAQARGYRGDVQWALLIVGRDNGSAGLDGSSNPQLPGIEPATAPRMANVTVLGRRGSPLTSSLGVLLRQGWRGRIHRAVIADVAEGFEQACIDIDDDLSSAMRISDVVFDCRAGDLVPCGDD